MHARSHDIGATGHKRSTFFMGSTESRRPLVITLRRFLHLLSLVFYDKTSPSINTFTSKATEERYHFSHCKNTSASSITLPLICLYFRRERWGLTLE